MKCTFHFPFDYCPQTTLEFEKIHTSCDNEHYRAKIVTKRNDSRLNNHQHLQLQGWRANCDIQVVIDHCACVEYLTKYAAKGEPRSPMLKIRGSFWTTVFRENGKPILKQFIRKPFSMTTGKRILKHFITKSFSVKIEYEFKYLLIKTNSTLHSGKTANTIICLI